MMHQLYRHFDMYGRLLYVGISVSALGRLAQHKHTAEWFNNIATITVVNYDTRGELEKAEIEAIRKERPKYNTRHNQLPAELQVEQVKVVKVMYRESCYADEDYGDPSEWECVEI